MTLCRVQRRAGWLLPAVAVVFAALAVGAAKGWLPWDDDIQRWTVEQRRAWRDTVAMRISWFGSTYVVLAVAAILAALAARRWPRLAVAIVVLTLARPLTEFLLKELVGRERPVGDRLVRGRGPSFPSGHPYAAAASWGMLPLVVAAYTRRRAVWWAAAIGAWTLIVLIAASRVWLGVHWASDVVGGVLLSVLGVYAAERLLGHLDPGFAPIRAGGVSV
ncbi:MAG: phosphatase PAP2 family protein [Ilumatobacteraceae bacterium]